MKYKIKNIYSFDQSNFDLTNMTDLSKKYLNIKVKVMHINKLRII